MVAGGADADLVLGEEGDDTLSGDSGDDVLDGGAGADSVLGGSGADAIDGGADGDTLVGGDGSDVFLGGPHINDPTGTVGHDLRVVGDSPGDRYGWGSAVGDFDGDGRTDWMVRATGHPWAARRAG